MPTEEERKRMMAEEAQQGLQFQDNPPAPIDTTAVDLEQLRPEVAAQQTIATTAATTAATTPKPQTAQPTAQAAATPAVSTQQQTAQPEVSPAPSVNASREAVAKTLEEAYDAKIQASEASAAAEARQAKDEADSFEDFYRRQDQLAKDRLQEDQEDAMRSRRAGITAGIAEFAANLINLGGTLAGGSNQVITPHAADWMKLADAKLETFKKDRRTTAEKLNEMQTRHRELLGKYKSQQAKGRAAVDAAKAEKGSAMAKLAQGFEAEDMRLKNVLARNTKTPLGADDIGLFINPGDSLPTFD